MPRVSCAGATVGTVVDGDADGRGVKARTGIAFASRAPSSPAGAPKLALPWNSASTSRIVSFWILGTSTASSPIISPELEIVYVGIFEVFRLRIA